MINNSFFVCCEILIIGGLLTTVSRISHRTHVIFFRPIGVNITDATSGFRAVSKDVIEFFSHHYAQDYPEPESIIAARVSGFRVKEVPVVMNERTAGESSINTFKSIYYMIKVTLAIVIYKLVGKKWR
jgi:hypothetical protein